MFPRAKIMDFFFVGSCTFFVFFFFNAATSFVGSIFIFAPALYDKSFNSLA
jgi:hypothetical protein